MAEKFVNLIFKGNQKIQYWFINAQEQQPVFYKRLFLKFSQNSQENTCARVSFLIKLQAWDLKEIKKRLWHKCFSSLLEL